MILSIKCSAGRRSSRKGVWFELALRRDEIPLWPCWLYARLWWWRAYDDPSRPVFWWHLAAGKHEWKRLPT